MTTDREAILDAIASRNDMSSTAVVDLCFEMLGQDPEAELGTARGYSEAMRRLQQVAPIMQGIGEAQLLTMSEEDQASAAAFLDDMKDRMLRLLDGDDDALDGIME